MLLRFLAVAGSISTVVACSSPTGNEAPPTIHVAQDPATAASRIAAFLDNRGFAVPTQGRAGHLFATATAGAIDPAWVDCELIFYRLDWQGDFAQPRVESASVTVALAGGAGSSEVQARAQFEGVYTNRFNNSPATAPCRSTGVLEGEILQAVNAG
jgi:hypothetical protein